MTMKFARLPVLISSVLALVAAAACSSSPSGVAGPSSLAPLPGSADAQGGTVRYYAANSGGGPVTAGSHGNSLSVTIKNCNGTGLCGASTTSAHQAIGSATVAVPAGFTVDSSSLSTSATGGKTWSATYAAGTITLLATQGTQKLDVGESVTVSFKADAPCTGGSYTFDTHSYQDTTLPSLTSYQRVGNDAAIVVTGNCATVCAQGLGYWKHAAAWPVSSLTIGTVSYNASQLLSILNETPNGNGLVILAHQLITAKLNLANGVDGTAVAATITAADGVIGSHSIPPVGSDVLPANAASPHSGILDTFNNGCANALP